MNLPPPTARQAKVIWFALTMLAVALTVAILGAVIWGMGLLIGRLAIVLWPIAVAGIIAFILDPVVEWFIHRGVPRMRAVALVFGAAVILVLGFFASIVPPAIGQARDLAERAGDYAARARTNLYNWVNNPPEWIEEPASVLLRFIPGLNADSTNAPAAPATPITPTNSITSTPPSAAENIAVAPAEGVEGTEATAGADGLEGTETAEGAEGDFLSGTNTPVQVHPAPAWWTKALDPRALRTAGDWAATVLPFIGNWMWDQLGRVAGWVGMLAGLALIPIYAFYFLLEKRSIERRWTDYLPVSNSRFKDELVWLLQNINDALIVFFRGQVLVAMCDGVLYSVGFLLIGLPYALLLGLVATVLTIVPFLGAIVTCASALIIAIVHFGDWQHPLLVVVVFAVVQGIEGWVIQPKIIGDRVGMHPVTIIIAILVGTSLMGGLIGGLLAIPATAVLRALMFRYVWRSSFWNTPDEGSATLVKASR